MGDMMAARLKLPRRVAAWSPTAATATRRPSRETGLPCYQVRNAPPATPIALHPVALDEPVGCAGVAVYPGDVLVGDRDGVVVIPRDLVDEVADEALDAVEYEEFAAAAHRARTLHLRALPGHAGKPRRIRRMGGRGPPGTGEPMNVNPDTAEDAGDPDPPAAT